MSQNSSSSKSSNHDNSQPSVAHGKRPRSNDASDTEAASNDAGSNHLLRQKQRRCIDSEEAEVSTPGDDEPSANASSSTNDASGEADSVGHVNTEENKQKYIKKLGTSTHSLAIRCILMSYLHSKNEGPLACCSLPTFRGRCRCDMEFEDVPVGAGIRLSTVSVINTLKSPLTLISTATAHEFDGYLPTIVPPTSTTTSRPAKNKKLQPRKQPLNGTESPCYSSRVWCPSFKEAHTHMGASD